MVLQPNLESVLNNVNKFINIDVHRQQYTEHFSNLRDIIFKHLRNNDVFSYIFNGFQLGGSYGDNVKVTIPNEFDLVFHITFPEQSLIIVTRDENFPGNVFLDFTKVIKKIAKEKQHVNNLEHLKKWLDSHNFLMIEKFQLYLQSCFFKVLMELENKIEFKGKKSFLSYKRQGPAHTIQVETSPDFSYSVDFVPGILLNDSQHVIPNLEGQWEAIPKPSRINHHHSISFRSSYYRQEQQIIRNKKQLKNAYRMLKKFRDTKTNMQKLKSYYIKTLFLVKSSQQDSEYWNKPLQVIIIDMFKDLEHSLREETLPFFWDHKLNLYEYYSDNLIRQMLSCVENTRKLLEKAAIELTLPLQNRVYCIFLNSNERKSLEQQNETVCILQNSIVEDIIPTNLKAKCLDEFSDDKFTAEDSKKQSAFRFKCVIC